MKAHYAFIVNLLLTFIAISSVLAQEKANKPGFEPVYYDVVQKAHGIWIWKFWCYGKCQHADQYFWWTELENAFVSCSGRMGSGTGSKSMVSTNAHLEPYEFGNGWDFDYVSSAHDGPWLYADHCLPHTVVVRYQWEGPRECHPHQFWWNYVGSGSGNNTVEN